MTKFELDNTMMKKLLKLADLCMMLNTCDKETKASFQLNHNRVMVVVQVHSDWESFPMYSYQRPLSQLTYADLDEAAAEITNQIKYAI